MLDPDRKTAVCVDLDGTISDDSTRRHLAPPPGSPLERWRAFHEASSTDKPLPGVLALLRSLRPIQQIHIVSGRWEELRASTEEWLARYDVPYDVLRLYSPTDVPAKNHEFKTAYVHMLRAQGIEVVFFVEAEPDRAAYIQAHASLPVLCVNSRYAIPC